MGAKLEKFSTASGTKASPAKVAGKLNLMVDAIMSLLDITTDAFISLKTTPTGRLSLSLNINQLLSRIPKPIRNPIEDGFWASLVSTGLVSGNQAKWTYTATEVTGQWTPTNTAQTLSGGRVVTAYNSVESGNPTSGIGQMKSGPVISSDDFSNGIKLQPIPDGAVYWVSRDNTCNSGSGTGTGTGTGASAPIYLFSAGNVKLECPD